MSRLLLRRSFSSSSNSNLLRLLTNEISYFSTHHPPTQSSFNSFSLQHFPAQQWLRLLSTTQHQEHIKIDATMFDRKSDVTLPMLQKAAQTGKKPSPPHISLIVEVSKRNEAVLQFVCSAWPQSIEVEKVFLLRSGGLVPYMGRCFRKLDDKVQGAVLGYLAEREVDGELAEFLHAYMANKEKTELFCWLKTVESYIQK